MFNFNLHGNRHLTGVAKKFKYIRPAWHSRRFYSPRYNIEQTMLAVPKVKFHTLVKQKKKKNVCIKLDKWKALSFEEITTRKISYETGAS